MRTILHFQKALQTRLCCRGRSENVTLDKSKVTCKNCLDLLKLSVRKKFNASVDWNALYVDLSDKKLPKIERALKEFLFANRQYQARCSVGNYPPHVWMRFWLPENGDKRRKTVAFNRNNDWLRGDIVQTLVPQEADMDIIATFVGQQAEEFGLTAKRVDREGAGLSYELKFSVKDRT